MSSTDPIQIQVRKSSTAKRCHEFLLHETMVASLQFVSVWREDAVLNINGNSWQIKRTGFWKRQTELKANQSPFTKLTIPFNWKYRISYRLANGAVYVFKPSGFWNRTWGWYDEQEHMVIGMRSITSFSKSRGEITFYKTPAEDLYLLMLLGWYQLTLYQRHAAAASA